MGVCFVCLSETSNSYRCDKQSNPCVNWYCAECYADNWAKLQRCSICKSNKLDESEQVKSILNALDKLSIKIQQTRKALEA